MRLYLEQKINFFHPPCLKNALGTFWPPSFPWQGMEGEEPFPQSRAKYQ